METPDLVHLPNWDFPKSIKEFSKRVDVLIQVHPLPAVWCSLLDVLPDGYIT